MRAVKFLRKAKVLKYFHNFAARRNFTYAVNFTIHRITSLTHRVNLVSVKKKRLYRFFVYKLGLCFFRDTFLCYDDFGNVFFGRDFIHHLGHNPFDDGTKSACARL